MSIKDTTALKALETKYKIFETKRNLVIADAEEKQAEAKKLKHQMITIKRQIESLKVKSKNYCI